MTTTWEENIYGLVPRREWLDVGFNVTRPNDPIDGLFDDQRTENIAAYWQSIASEYQVPVMAQFHAFDTESQTTFRIPVDTHSVEKGLIKVKINQSERMRELVKSGISGDAMYDYVVNDGVRLADQVVTRTKVAKNELMATGKVTIDENNLKLTVDYGVPEDQTSELDFTIEAGDDAPASIQKIIDAAADKGVTLTGLLTSRANITKLRSNTAIQKAINGTASAGALVRATALAAYLEDEFGISRIITNDLTYAVPDGIGEDGRPKVKMMRYFPKKTMSFFATNPAGKMGVGAWGDPPDLTNSADVQQLVRTSGVNPFVFIKQWTENDPDVLWTRASGLFMPILFNPNSLWIASTAGE